MAAFAIASAALATPSTVLAAGGENVALEFTQGDYIYLGISAVLAIVAIVYGMMLRSKLSALSPGDEKMQEVGAAIHDGAIAYLKQQGALIAKFVALLGAGLFALYLNTYGMATSGLITLCFVLGVAASYGAGWLGMDMAVKANMRTANAALTSYKKSLEIAFQSGAVAGMITVGFGLLGATVIFMVAQADAMKLLIGFGFGGSLAALFMRVGGGIYTKAADVGADLVGKVEAGIPEDDPRNPAVIADNVGDNVGDCAGMAADVFESYEVTLVAAIILGAATAAIFPTEIWMKLILFALMARGVGIIASIYGIATVKGSDDLNSDPLKPISGGFRRSAAVAMVLTAILAYVMMGGVPSITPQISATQLNSTEKYQRVEDAKIRKVQLDLMKTNAEKVIPTINKAIAAAAAKLPDKDVAKVTADELMKDASVKGLISAYGFPLVPAAEAGKTLSEADKKKQTESYFTEEEFKNFVVTPLVGKIVDPKAKILPDFKTVSADLLMEDPDVRALAKKSGQQEAAYKGAVVQRIAGADPVLDLPPLKKAEGFAKLNFADARVKDYTIAAAGSEPMAPPTYASFVENQKPKEKFANLDDLYVVYRLKITTQAPGAAGTEQQVQEVYYGPVIKKAADNQIKQAVEQPNSNLKVERMAIFPTEWLINAKGDLALGVIREAINVKEVTDANKLTAAKSFMDQPQRVAGFGGFQVYKEAKAVVEKNAQNPASGIAPITAEWGFADHAVAHWWQFALCILFGILMAFAFEMMTDYYVSTHRKPTQEVAGVSSAGPAPMIIQGFALGLESSVFSVFAICISLVMPLLIFPPEFYGGYVLSFYGIALVGLGLLTTTGYILAMDTFGPISDNAQGVFEMSGAGHSHPEAAMAVQRLDAAGNTTKALTKGFAIATAVVAAVALFHSYIEGAKLGQVDMPLGSPEVFVGLLIGGAAPFLFSAFLINAVGRASFNLIGEVRRQFRNDPGIMEGTSKPDYAECVRIVTEAAQRELLAPGILALALPIFVAFGLAIGKESTIVNGVAYNLVGAQALGGFLAGSILSGQLLAVLLANSGGIWDNAKKIIEDGLHGGKGTDAHKAGVVCDTVGDPFKDTAGPALNPLIKVMNLIALLIAPKIIFDGDDGTRIAVTLVCVALVVFAVWKTKQGSMTSMMDQMVADVKEGK
jgi:Na+/H+-translocating membrane pyrophosphatase